MKINSITTRSILKEMFTPFGLNMVFFTFLFLMTKILDITNWIVNYNISIFVILEIIFFTIPYFLMFIIPMSVMLAIMLTFLRMSGDNEIVALKSCGLSIHRLIPPVFLFSFLGFGLTLFMTLVGIPWGTAATEELALKVAASNINIGLKERTFNDSFKNVMLYVNSIDLKSKRLVDVFIEDKRQPDVVSTVIAPEGKIFSESGKYVFQLRLFNGAIHQTNLKDRSANSIQFSTYNIQLDLSQELRSNEDREKSREEMSIRELRQYIENSPEQDTGYYKAKMVLHRRFAIPVACFALGLLAFPLGIQSKTSKRSFGLILGLFFFFFYYLLLTAGYTFGETGVYPPVIGMWLPDVVIGGIGIYFFIQTLREKTLKVNLAAQYIYTRIVKLTKFGRSGH